MRATFPARGTRRGALLVLVPLAAALAFLVLLATRFRAVIATLYLNGDTASAPVIAELLPQRAGSQVVLGDYRWLEPLYLMRVTSVLPGHRQVWIVLPLLLFAVALAATTWAVRRAAGPGRAALAFAVLACPAPVVLAQIGVLNAHGPVLFHAALLAAALVAFVVFGAAWSAPRLIIASLALALVTAPGVAGEQLLIPAGLVPVVIAAGALRATRVIGWRVTAALVCAMGGALAGGTALTAYATSEKIVGTGLKFQLGGLQAVLDQLRLFAEDLALVGHGSFGGPLTFWPVAHYGLALVALAGIALVLRRVRAAGPHLPELPPAAQALVVFWGAAFALVLLAFVSTTAAVDAASVRYALVAWPALVTLACVLATPRLGFVALSLVTTLGSVAGITELVRNENTTSLTPFPRGDVAGQLARFVQSRHLDHGYAEYWSAATLTYQTKYVAKVYPVSPCGPGLCPFKLHRIDAWYAPRPRVRTFIIEDAGMIAPAIGAPPPGWGATETAHFGQLTVRVYPYDVAKRLGPSG